MHLVYANAVNASLVDVSIRNLYDLADTCVRMLKSETSNKFKLTQLTETLNEWLEPLLRVVINCAKHVFDHSSMCSMCLCERLNAIKWNLWAKTTEST